jgi:CubicO group peptidase (beta-lactamase class C family)
MKPVLPFLLSLTISTAALAEPHLDATKLAEVPKRMQEFVEKDEIAGAVTLVLQHGRVAQLAAVGKSDLASGRALKPDDLFWIASMTKPMTAVCVLILQDERKLSIEDPVEKYLPEFKGEWVVSEFGEDRRVLVKSPRPITLRDLLTHTSGLGDVKSPRPHSTLAELCMAYAREPLFFPPGSKWNYCNSGINTLGRIVEIVSGQPFAEFLQQRVLDPLGMKDTTFWPTPAQAARLAKSYQRNKEGKLEEISVFFTEGPLSDKQRTPFPSGGLYSTAEDVAAFYQMMLNGGAFSGRTILKTETVALMTTTQSGNLKTGFVEGMSWGLGFQVVKEPRGVTASLSPGSFGHGGAYATQSWADPKRDLIFVLMIQRAGLPNGDASEMRKVFQDTAVAALVE